MGMKTGAEYTRQDHQYAEIMGTRKVNVSTTIRHIKNTFQQGLILKNISKIKKLTGNSAHI